MLQKATLSRKGRDEFRSWRAVEYNLSIPQPRKPPRRADGADVMKEIRVTSAVLRGRLWKFWGIPVWCPSFLI